MRYSRISRRVSCVSWSDFAVLSAVLPDFLKNHRNLTQPELVDYTWREEFGYDGAGGRRRCFYNSLNRVERAVVNEGMAKILNYEYDGLGRRVGMSSTLSGHTR